MSKRKSTTKQKLFTTLMALFMIGGSTATIAAMQANPPDNLDQVVLGNVDAQTIAAGDGVSSDDAAPPRFFTIINDDNDGRRPRRSDNTELSFLDDAGRLRPDSFERSRRRR